MCGFQIREQEQLKENSRNSSDVKVDLRAEEKKGSLGTTESHYYVRNRNHRDLKDLLIILALRQ